MTPVSFKELTSKVLGGKVEQYDSVLLIQEKYNQYDLQMNQECIAKRKIKKPFVFKRMAFL